VYLVYVDLVGGGAESSVITYIKNDWNKERNQRAGPRKKHGGRNKGPGGRFPVIREGLTQVIAACPLSIDAFPSLYCVFLDTRPTKSDLGRTLRSTNPST